ncbi:hypothetical protein [Candidatus Methanoperedens nitratireducens]|nr:hypothetical protein [Candidatus Methanoperedens nitroreducens]
MKLNIFVCKKCDPPCEVNVKTSGTLGDVPTYCVLWGNTVDWERRE